MSGAGAEEDAATGEAVGTGDQRFLTDERIEEIGRRIAPMIVSDSSWIERRKEAVQILDDSALRRQISVDFSLRRGVTALPEFAVRSEGLYCAPIFVLPKSPSALGAFDLCDEDGHSLPLISRDDNAAISGAMACALVASQAAVEVGDLPEGLRAELQRLATLESERSEVIARRLLAADGPWPEVLRATREDERAAGWLETIAHSSIVVILFRSSGPRRKLVKLTFQEEINKTERRLTRLGWAPYEVIIDSPRIEARSFHFEAEAPSGLRISQAQLTDSEREDPVGESGSMKRVHLYRRHAERAGAGTAVLSLDVAGPGFVSGAMLASLLTVIALVACALRADSIASNPTSAPALLLVLPGLIASYVARPDRHALTTRLLSFARGLLLGVAFCAYVAAARVALAGAKPSGADAVSGSGNALAIWLWILTVFAVIATAMLFITWLRGSWLTRALESEYRFTCSRVAELPTKEMEAATVSPVADCPQLADYTTAAGFRDGELELNRSAWHGEWTLTLKLEAIAESTLIGATLDYVDLIPPNPLASRERSREAEKLVRYLDGLAGWSKREVGLRRSAADRQN
jgi:hypothetical protein